MLPNNSLLQINFASLNPTQILKTRTYLQNAPFAENHWQIIKQVYKKLEAHPHIELLSIIIDRLDTTTFEDIKVEKFPTIATLAYMKRRARRFLRKKALENPKLYLAICQNLLKKNVKREIDFKHQWILVDIILGSSKRFEHKQHGRGSIIATQKGSPFNRKEEQQPQVWNEEISYLKSLLFENHNLHIADFAAKVILRNHQNLTEKVLNKDQLDLFFESPNMPLLKTLAAQNVFQYFEKATAEHWAYTYFYSPADRRKNILMYLGETKRKAQNKKSFWDKVHNIFNQKNDGKNKQNIYINFTEVRKTKFVKTLSKLLFDTLKTQKISSRTKDSIDFIVKYKRHIPQLLLTENANVLLNAKSEKLRELGFWAAESTSSNDVVMWLGAADPKDTIMVDRLIKLFLTKNTNKRLSRYEVQKYVLNDAANIANFGWQLVAKQHKPKEHVQHIWHSLYWRGWDSLPFQYAVTQEIAVKLLLEHFLQALNWLRWNKDTCIKIVKNGHPDLSFIMLEKVLENARGQFLSWLPFIAQLTDKRDKILAENQVHFEKNNIRVRELANCLTDSDGWIKNVTWDLLEKKSGDKKVMEDLVYTFVHHYEKEDFEFFAKELFSREKPALEKQFIDSLKNNLKDDSSIVNQISQYLKEIITHFSGAELVDLASATASENWTDLKPLVLKELEGNKKLDFWLKTLKILETEQSILQSRVWEDEDFLPTFYAIENIGILSIKHPIFEENLEKWLLQHQVMFTKNSPELLTAAKHPLPKIRNWALKRIQKKGLNTAFALGLMEFELPDTFEVGQQFFEGSKNGSDEEMEGVLALCDSPKASVRAYGLQFLKARQEHINDQLVLKYLAEHSDPFIQQFVAKKLLEQSAKSVKKQPATLKSKPANFVKDFDKTIFRQKNRNRKTKELVKSRVAQNPETFDAKNLLELARGQNKKDSEWAILQLTKLALSGQEIEGFQLH